MTPSHWEEKCWGRVAHVFVDEHAAVSVLKVNKGFRCSRHHHNYRVNQFTCLSGSIVIEEWRGTEKTWITLEEGDTHSVPAGVVHRFTVIESGQVIEVYWADGGPVRIEDIVRLDEGGPILV